MKLIVIALGALFLVTSCASNQERFEKIEVGMEKHDVLELVGNPRYTRRYRGIDRWGFVFYDQGKRSEQQVHFKEGVVVYSGDRPEPTISAEEQDSINARENANLASQQTQQMQEYFQSKKRLQNDYIDYQMGTQQGTRVPKFEPVGNQ